MVCHCHCPHNQVQDIHVANLRLAKYVAKCYHRQAVTMCTWNYIQEQNRFNVRWVRMDFFFYWKSFSSVVGIYWIALLSYLIKNCIFRFNCGRFVKRPFAENHIWKSTWEHIPANVHFNATYAWNVLAKNHRSILTNEFTQVSYFVFLTKCRFVYSFLILSYHYYTFFFSVLWLFFFCFYIFFILYDFIVTYFAILFNCD